MDGEQQCRCCGDLFDGDIGDDWCPECYWGKP